MRNIYSIFHFLKNMRVEIVSRLNTLTLNRNKIEHAFVSRENMQEEQERTPLLNTDGESIHNVVNETREKINNILQLYRIVLPVYKQGETIGRTAEYLIENLKVPAENITAISVTEDDENDHGNEIMKSFDIFPLLQEDVLNSCLDVPRFLDILQAESLDQIRGKGLTMLAAYIQLQKEKHPELFVAQIDSDITNIGQEYDPIRYMAWAQKQRPDLDAVKMAKNGRNNQPILTFLNTLSIMGENSKRYTQCLQYDRWLLTGEYGIKSKYINQLVMATGYSIEMVLGMGQVERNLQRYQIEAVEPRIDGKNTNIKEGGGMYTDICRTVYIIAQQKKLLSEMGIGDITRINEDIIKRAGEEPIYAIHDPDTNPGPKALKNEKMIIEPSRLIPSIDVLRKEKVLKI